MKYATSRVLRVLEAAEARSQSRRAAVTMGCGATILAAVMGLGVCVNLSPSAPRGVYRAVTGSPTRGAWVVACVDAEAAALGRARGYLGPGPCVGGAQPIVKPVVAVAGDVVEVGPQALIVNGQSFPGSASAAVDSLERPLPHAVWGRHLVGADELWLVSTRVPNSWDSRYLGPFSVSQIRAVVCPVWTVD